MHFEPHFLIKMAPYDAPSKICQALTLNPRLLMQMAVYDGDSQHAGGPTWSCFSFSSLETDSSATYVARRVTAISFFICSLYASICFSVPTSRVA